MVENSSAILNMKIITIKSSTMIFLISLFEIRGISDEISSNFFVIQAIGRLEFEDGLRIGRYPPGVLPMTIGHISALSPRPSQST